MELSSNHVSSVSMSKWTSESEKNITLSLVDIDYIPTFNIWSVTDMDIVISDSDLSKMQMTVKTHSFSVQSDKQKQKVILFNSTIGHLIGMHINLHAIQCNIAKVIQLFPIFNVNDSIFQFSNCNFQNISWTSTLDVAMEGGLKPRTNPIFSLFAVVKAWRSHILVKNSIFCNNFGTLFNVQDKSSLEMVNSTICSNKGYAGCSIFAANHSSVRLVDTIFKDNIYLNATINVQKNSYIKMTDCTFLENSGGVRKDNALGSTVAIRYNTSFQITSCIFSDNQASHGGSLFLGPNGYGTIDNCTFYRNVAIQGGAINAQNGVEVRISNSKFDNNSALEIPGEDRSRGNAQGNAQATAGAISVYSAHAVIEGSEFRQNMALYGGRILIERYALVEINNSKFEFNLAFEGGAILINQNSSLYIYNTSFIENAATERVLQDRSRINQILEHSDIRGGAILGNVYALIVVELSTFRKNVARFGGALCVSDNTSLSIGLSLYQFNLGEQGGAIYAMREVNINITASIFQNNSAISCDKLIDICIAETQSKYNKMFTGPTGGSVFEAGGGISASKGVNISISDSVFRNHLSYFGAVLALYDNVVFSIRFSTFQFNLGAQGGILYSSQNAYGILLHCRFENNKSPMSGLIHSFGNSETDSLLEMSYCEFKNNTAGQFGSPISLRTNVHLVMSFSNVTGNRAQREGGVFYCSDSSLHVYNSEFRSNLGKSGSIIYSEMYKVSTDYNIMIHNSTLVDNLANNEGAIITAHDTKIIISHSIFKRNIATNGGVVSSYSGDIIISNSYFYENKASSAGGVLYFLPSKSNILAITYSTFEKNRAGLEGAVLYSQESFDIAIDSCTFINNNAAFEQAIYLVNCWSLLTSYVTFNTIHSTLSKQSYVYFTNNKKVLYTKYGTYKTSFLIRSGNISTNSSMENFRETIGTSGMIKVDQESMIKYITQGETPFASGSTICSSVTCIHINGYTVNIWVNQS